MLEKTGTISTITLILAVEKWKGAPAPGTLEIKVRAYAGQSNSALTSFSFRLIGEPTVGGFLDTFSNKSMFPFHFQKIGFACILPLWVCHFIRAHYTCFLHNKFEALRLRRRPVLWRMVVPEPRKFSGISLAIGFRAHTRIPVS